MNPGRCVALTGGIACGKSAVAQWWRQWGAETLDADEVVHRLLAPDGVCVRTVAEAFGPEVLAADGGIDRDRGVEFRHHERVRHQYGDEADAAPVAGAGPTGRGAGRRQHAAGIVATRSRRLPAGIAALRID